VRGLARRSHADALSAALMYSLAVLSKETAVMLPAAAFVAGLIVAVERRFMLRHAALYLACCVPAAGLVTLLVRGKIGAAYEPDFGVVTAQIAQAGAPATAWSPWLESAVTQMGLYFRYLALWIFPDSGALSIDLRVDLAGRWRSSRWRLSRATELWVSPSCAGKERRVSRDSGCSIRGSCSSPSSPRSVSRSRSCFIAATCGVRA
jgi:hypothetical protein